MFRERVVMFIPFIGDRLPGQSETFDDRFLLGRRKLTAVENHEHRRLDPEEYASSGNGIVLVSRFLR